MVGNVDFDPLGLSSPNNIKWMREAELKHGRMSMLAWTVRVCHRSLGRETQPTGLQPPSALRPRATWRSTSG